MKTLALIPARGGSKGISRKNVRPFAGKPLIAWTVEVALQCRCFDDVVVSTDDEEIAEVAREYGARTPFMRPTALAQDDTPSIAPVLHALEQLPGLDALVLLQPTSPLRTVEDIHDCLVLAEERAANSIVSVTQTDTHPYWMYRLSSQQRLEALLEAPEVTRRQDMPPVYALNGALYFARTEWLVNARRLVAAESLAFVMPPSRSVDIDTPLDWKFAEMLLREQV